MVVKQKRPVKSTILGYELSSKQDALYNYLIPSLSSCFLYIFIIASDIAVIFRHYKGQDWIWAGLTIFFMYLPIIGSFLIIITDWDLWPDQECWTRRNIKWFIRKTLEHILFPIWRMWRFAEQIFWSIESLRSKDEKEILETKAPVTCPRSIELYIFLQAFLHSLPQILLQLNTLIRSDFMVSKQTKDAQILSVVFNLASLAITTVNYQRFKSQKLTGRQYPWFKPYKKNPESEFSNTNEKVNTENEEETLSTVKKTGMKTIMEQEPEDEGFDEVDFESNVEFRNPLKRKMQQFNDFLRHKRGSSQFYLEPVEVKEMVLLETDFDEDIKTRQSFISFSEKTPKSISSTSRTEPDFKINRVVYIKGLAHDDIAGKLIAFIWWYCFLIARILALSAFAFFFPYELKYIVISHIVIVLIVLLYDVKTDGIRRSKLVFFVFLSFVYVFCIIEFKIKFKKAKFIYYGFFVLVFLENVIMCSVWYICKIESLENDFWFKYIFIFVVLCNIASASAMIFYFNINEPKKVVVDRIVLPPKI